MAPKYKIEKIWKYVWTELAPFKVEAFIWLLMHKKLVVTCLLNAKKRGKFRLVGGSCAVVNELFPLTSEPSLKNEVIFSGKEWNVDQCLDLVKVRVASWSNAEWPTDHFSIMDTNREPLARCQPRKNRKNIKNTLWTAPDERTLKFNIDGAAQECPRLVGIGGLLPNYKGEVKIIFCKHIGEADSNLAKYRTIMEAFAIFAVSKWKEDYSLLIESDSCNAIKWIKAPASAPWRLKKWTLQIERFKEIIGNWSIKHTKRDVNQRANRLAKDGVHLSHDILRVFE
ncbi:Uncharacterized protein TCM_014846 [Theobroma cacao]|uniref:RNase H type-1 domain-containing protein n=1 Tax=Theobroma cacao TaxID=3641 RepID=A0A061G6X4_THECC|nr:Uncharacterized protein TCM_014846 [Theobroma cacao]